MKGFEDQYTYGRRPNGIYVPRFRNINEATKQKDYLRGFGYQGGASRGREGYHEGIGAEFKESLTELRANGPCGWVVGANILHLTEDNRVTLSKDKKDKWGLPLADIDCDFKENERAMRKDMKDSAAEMLEKKRAERYFIHSMTQKQTPVCAFHEMGTARMGKDPKDVCAEMATTRFAGRRKMFLIQMVPVWHLRLARTSVNNLYGVNGKGQQILQWKELKKGNL